LSTDKVPKPLHFLFMHKVLLSILLILLGFIPMQAQVYHGRQAEKLIPGAESLWIPEGSGIPSYVKLRQEASFDRSGLMQWLGKNYDFSDLFGLQAISVYDDKIGGIHYRYRMTFEGHPIHDGMIIAHESQGKVYAVNGSFRPDLSPANQAQISESAALQLALAHVNALRYKWQMPEEEALLKVITDNPNATYYPTGELVMMPRQGLSAPHTHLYAWKFNVYADQPLSKKDIFINAQTGEVIFEMDRIHVGNANGTAVTKYSGTQTITTDSVNPNLFRLRETERGLGIETYNLQNGTSYGAAVDFIDTDNYWNNVNSAKDEVATDAHWGAEMTYDYYYQRYGRNSIDDNGFKLMSYVHYSTNYANAFWDGVRMTYGDGNTTWSPLVALDICAHEITHGLTTFTADLDYQDESGAMNEAYSDIFGTAIEFYAKPTMANWLIGENIGNAMRSMANPNQYGDPDCYNGTYFYVGPNDNGGVHTNSGVFNHWFYLLTAGGSGTNDLNNSYSIAGIGIANAGSVAYRTLAVYLVNSSQFTDGRFYSIQSATDLFGPCSPEVASTTNAMYAVGIGPAYIPGVDADFSADITEFCAPPATVKFNNLSNNANSFVWDFGDNSSSTQMNPTHTYTAMGTYNVKLISSGGTCGTDSVLMTALISVDPGNPCVVNMPLTGSISQNTCSGKLLDSGGSGNYQNNVNSTVVIAPTGASQLTLTFLSFDFEAGYDYLKIYNGPNSSSPLIGSYDGTALPNGGTIVVNGGAVTLVQTSDQGLTGAGFEMNWVCSYPTAPPAVSFKVSDTASCSGQIQFFDQSLNGPNGWQWDFGDGNSSTQQNPLHTYQNSGTYTVTLIATNSFGSNSMVMSNAVTINLPVPPAVADQASCNGATFTFTAQTPNPVLWYDTWPGGTVIDTSHIFTTPFLSSSKYYYCESVVAKPIQNVGKTSNSGGGGYFTSSNIHFLVFDAYQEFTLKSVKVYAQTAGNRTITLRNNNGTILLSKTVNIPIGEQRVTLDFKVPAGTNLQLAGPGTPNLFRSNAAINFPYTITNVLSIKYSSATTDPTGYYYYFYDWEVQEKPCLSPIDSVLAHVSSTLPDANFSYMVNDPDVDFLNSSLDAAFSLWDFGDGNSSALGSPTHVYQANGTYQVKLVSSNGCGSDSLSQSVTIQTVGIEDATIGTLKVFPNPGDGRFMLQAIFNTDCEALIEVFDLSGRLVYSESAGTSSQLSRELDLRHISAGSYVLRVSTATGSMMQKMTKS
jgi:Zn-dependent metalloprotease